MCPLFFASPDRRDEQRELLNNVQQVTELSCHVPPSPISLPIFCNGSSDLFDYSVLSHKGS
jgi:hypothetical protein